MSYTIAHYGVDNRIKDMDSLCAGVESLGIERDSEPELIEVLKQRLVFRKARDRLSKERYLSPVVIHRVKVLTLMGKTLAASALVCLLVVVFGADSPEVRVAKSRMRALAKKA